MLTFRFKNLLDVRFELLAQDMTNLEEKGKSTIELTFVNGN